MTWPNLLKVLKLRINRRLFWAGFALLVAGTALAARSYPWVLNGGFVLPWVLLHAARLHDFGRQGIWALVVVSVLLLAFTALAVAKPPTFIYGTAAILGFLVLGLFTLWTGLKRGDAGANRFGTPATGWRMALQK